MIPFSDDNRGAGQGANLVPLSGRNAEAQPIHAVVVSNFQKGVTFKTVISRISFENDILSTRRQGKTRVHRSKIDPGLNSYVRWVEDWAIRNFNRGPRTIKAKGRSDSTRRECGALG